jgi:hypothetical protein
MNKNPSVSYTGTSGFDEKVPLRGFKVRGWQRG